MSNDHLQPGDASTTPPDRASAGDVSTTGHSAHDMQAADTTRDTGHGPDTSDIPTLVPTTWRQLLFPALILLLVLVLVAGPISGAFQTRPAAPTTEQNNSGAEGGGGSQGASGEPTPMIEGGLPTATVDRSGERTAVASPTVEADSTPTTGGMAPPTEATKTAVALAGASGIVARQPVQLQVGATLFSVKAGSGLLPDWKPAEAEGIATWIEGTVANHVLYLPYSTQNATIFTSAKVGDEIRLVMNTGQAFYFNVTRSERAANGPTSAEGQLDVASAMAQDHAGVTLFLAGDPAPDRAVVQADFNGTIQ